METDDGGVNLGGKGVEKGMSWRVGSGVETRDAAVGG